MSVIDPSVMDSKSDQAKEVFKEMIEIVNAQLVNKINDRYTFHQNDDGTVDIFRSVVTFEGNTDSKGKDPYLLYAYWEMCHKELMDLYANAGWTIRANWSCGWHGDRKVIAYCISLPMKTADIMSGLAAEVIKPQ